MPKMFFHISLRAQQSLLLTTPQAPPESCDAVSVPALFRMRAASIMIAQPMALSVAPVAACHESRWPPSMITSSALSVPGISAIAL